MSSELLERLEKPEHAAGDEEYCLPNNNQCHLKLDFDNESYTLTWPTPVSAQEYVERFEPPGANHHSTLIGRNEGLLRYERPGLTAEDLPDEPTSIEFESEETSYHWTRFPSHYRIGFTSSQVEDLDSSRTFFKQTVDDESFDSSTLTEAYDDVIKEVRDRR